MTRFRHSRFISIALVIAIISALVIPFGSVTAFASSEEDFQYVSYSGSAYIQKYLGNDENVVIPSTLNGNTVTTIDDNAFKDCESVKSVTIPATVTRIDSSAFEGCINLETVSIPNSVTYLGGRAFYGCESLTTVTVPSSVTYIGPEPFSRCTLLEEIKVDSGSKGYTSADGVLMDIGKTRVINFPAAKDCEVYTVPTTVTGINKSAFAGCTNLTEIILPPKTALYIYEYAFDGCSSLESINLPSNTMSIYNYAFDGCTSLKEFTVDPNNGNFTAVDGVLFNKAKTKIVRYPCAKTDESYSIPKTVTYVEYGGFADCVNLKSVKAHSSFYSFRDETFRGCTGLTSITLPASMTSVGSRTFEGCTSLESISISSANIYYSAKDGVLFDKNKTMIHYYPQGKSDASYTIPNTVKTIDKRAFYGADNLTKLVIPNSVQAIREDAFIGCDNLTIYAKSESYAYKYATDNGLNAVINDIVASVEHDIVGTKITFRITTYPGDYNRIKLTTPDNLKGSLAVANTYTVNEDGNYVWTIKTVAPKSATEYAFDFRSSETGKYLQDYSYYEAEIISDIKSVSYEKLGSKTVFTVTTSAGDFDRVKMALSDNPTGYIAYTNDYTVNEDGDFVWQITANTPSGEQEYAFDVRSADTKVYSRKFVYCTVVPTIKSVSARRSGTILTVTVTTVPGDFDRVRCGPSTSTIGNLANANSYTVNYYGEYIWTFKLELPDKAIPLYLDVRNSNTGKFIKDYYVFNYTT